MSFAVGSHVLAKYNKRTKNGLSNRLRGPLLVKAVEHDNVYKLEHPTTGNIETWHASRLVAYDASRTPDPRLVVAADDDEDVIDAIVDHKWETVGVFRLLGFLVRYVDRTKPEEWLNIDFVKDTVALDEYLAAHPDALQDPLKKRRAPAGKKKTTGKARATRRADKEEGEEGEEE
jgi:hypothetical protein